VADPLLAAARHLVGESLAEMRASIDGLPAEALNWRPAGDGTNSIAALAVHNLYATRLWLRLAMGLPLPERDRDSEFRAAADDADAFRRLVDELSAECLAALDPAEEVDWGALRDPQGRGGNAPPAVPAAYALIHATEHLRGHVDQISLMRHLWDAR
jgi:uncharacterized damage-inducible protein DinB